MTTVHDQDGSAPDSDSVSPEPSLAPPPLDRTRRRQMLAGAVALLVVAAGLVAVWQWNEGDSDQVATVAAPANPGPQVGDHWHVYFGLAVCTPDFTTVPPGAPGRGMFTASTSDPGVMHIQPTDASNAGANATVNRFLSAFTVQLADGQILVGGQPFYTDRRCTNPDGTPGEPGVLTWTVGGRALGGNPGDYVPADGDVILVSYNPKGTRLIAPTGVDEVLAQPAPHADLASAQAQAACLAVPAPAPITEPKSYPAAPPLTIDAAKTYTARLTTSCGDVVIALDAAKAPNIVNSFVFLAREGYFDGTPLHRIVPDFVVQGGDPTGSGSGTPGYTVNDENLGPTFAPGTVAMANSGPNTNGSQFFIVTSADGAAQLNSTPNYPIFGTVTEGLDAVEVLDSFGDPESETGQPLDALYVLEVTITES